MASETALTDLERRALLSAIAGARSETLRECLTKQISGLRVTGRQDDRPWGFYTYFDRSGPEPVGLTNEEKANRKPLNVWGIYGKRDNPISFSVYITDGLIDYLEASTTESDWPENEELIEFVYD